MQRPLFRSLAAALIALPLTLSMAACDGDGSDEGGEPTGTLTATIGPSAYAATSFSRTPGDDLSIISNSDDGQLLSLAFVGISGPGEYSMINLFSSASQGVAGGYAGGGENYNIESGPVNITTYTDSRVAGTFQGMARGLIGAADLPVTNGAFDIRF